jgi:O-antigen biosynthesis protein WbqP
LTGWAQVNGRDEIPVLEKVALDAEYLRQQSLSFDMQIMWLTFFKVMKSEGITH